MPWMKIDDINERPTRWQYLNTDRAGALRDLVDMGVGISEACSRLHVSRDSLERWCERHDMRAEYATLLGREDAMQDYGRGRSKYAQEAS